TRPTSDRVREALFSSLGDAVTGAAVLDLFAGSGALGLESISRGAARAVFVERSRRALPILRANVKVLGCEDRCRIVPCDALAALDRLARTGDAFDIVFLDPPYAGDLLDRSLAGLLGSKLLAQGAVVIAEHPSAATLDPPPGLEKRACRKYGDTALTFVAERHEDTI
ncbi:MAG: 16S rRNA (guanine(966)-N(2))-methyltransferase RsmD, partial [Deltaproteobacteria bacterium]|nr:16S rRNA (guanine(966)-N(2))-methyltransferase RsmD [Deltaproteobacteria bacterium]